MKAVLKAENRELKVEHRELKAEHQELKSKFDILEKQMAEIHQFTIPRIPRSSNSDQDSGLIVRSQGTNSTFNKNIKKIFFKIPIKISFRSRYGCIFFIGFCG